MQNNLEWCKKKLVKFLYSILSRLGVIEKSSPFKRIPAPRLDRVNNSFVLRHIKFIFGKEILWDDMLQPHSLLLWLLGFHGKKYFNNPFVFIFGTELHGPGSCYGY